MRRIQMPSKKREEVLSLVFLMMAVIGGWINAQGEWVKDFAYHRIVGLPLFGWNFTVSGITWYKVGIIDDLLGVFMIIFGLIMFRRHSYVDIGVIASFRIAIPFLVLYGFLDFIGYYLFSSYYFGNFSLTLYGEAWNTILYFGMMPLLLIACVIILGSRKGSFFPKKDK